MFGCNAVLSVLSSLTILGLFNLASRKRELAVFLMLHGCKCSVSLPSGVELGFQLSNRCC